MYTMVSRSPISSLDFNLCIPVIAVVVLCSVRSTHSIQILCVNVMPNRPTQNTHQTESTARLLALQVDMS